jgi:hypothetical protein
MGRTLSQDMFQDNIFLLECKDLDAAETVMEVFTMRKHSKRAT